MQGKILILQPSHLLPLSTVPCHPSPQMRVRHQGVLTLQSIPSLLTPTANISTSSV